MEKHKKHLFQGRNLGRDFSRITQTCFFCSAFQGKTLSSGWTKAQEAARLSQIPHFHFKEIWKKTKYLVRLGFDASSLVLTRHLTVSGVQSVDCSL